MNEKELITYLKDLGIDVRTSTRARGHQGFYLNNRIDIAQNTPHEKRIPTLIHEFAHYIHSQIEPDMAKTGGHLEAIFKTNEAVIFEELINVTHLVDTNSLCEKLKNKRQLIKTEIKRLEKIIKTYYPKFKRTLKFKEFERYIKNSDARFLLKYDRVKLIKGFWHKTEKIYTIETLENDFADMPEAFTSYIKLKSYQKKSSKLSAKINKNLKYYSKPTELFARFIQGLYMDKNKVELLAPTCTEIFYELLDKNEHFQKLKLVLNT